MTKRFRLLFHSLSPTAQRARGAATAVEMALLAPVFFLFLMGTTELSLIVTAQQLLENATFNATRLAKSGYTATGETQQQTVSAVLDNELGSFGTFFDPSKVTMTSTAYNTFANIGTGGTSGFGVAQQIVVYSISYPWKLFTPMMGQIIGTWNEATQNWVINLTAQIVVQNEPY